ncbi:hypothetical protein D3C86_1531270 [compost metagenome]
MTEHWADIPQALLLIVQKTMFDAGTYAARRSLRTQRQAIAIAVLKGIHLFFNDVSDFTDRAFEQWGLLYNRQTDFAVTVAAEHLFQGAFNALPDGGFARQIIVHAANGLNVFCHVYSLSIYKKEPEDSLIQGSIIHGKPLASQHVIFQLAEC